MPTENASPITPMEVKWPRGSIEVFAEQIARADQISFSPGMDMIDVVDKIGGKLSITDVWTDGAKDGSLVVDEDGHFSIFLPSHTSYKRDRFTIAHELGHYFLHYLTRSLSERRKGMIAYRYGSNRAEWEANWFAAAFLMPKQEFESAFKECGGSILQVSELFDVSESSASVRASVLGLVD
jgi:Zn-dependent peptidase ImmA (M78 family)